MAEKHRKIDSNALSLGELLRRPVVFMQCCFADFSYSDKTYVYE